MGEEWGVAFSTTSFPPHPPSPHLLTIMTWCLFQALFTLMCPVLMHKVEIPRKQDFLVVLLAPKYRARHTGGAGQSFAK